MVSVAIDFINDAKCRGEIKRKDLCEVKKSLLRDEVSSGEAFIRILRMSLRENIK